MSDYAKQMLQINFKKYMGKAVVCDAVVAAISAIVWLWSLIVKTRPTATVQQVSHINTWFIMFAINIFGAFIMATPTMENTRESGPKVMMVFKYVVPIVLVVANVTVLAVREVQLKNKLKKKGH
jgi:hypothetical protein